MQEIGDWLDRLIEHEAAYAGMAARCERTSHALFLHAPDLPEYVDANRALRLRTEGMSADAVADAVAAYFRLRGLRPAAEVDDIAEEQGIGAALRKIGIQPVGGDRLSMRYPLDEPPSALPKTDATVETVPNETGRGEAAEWIETAVADDVGWPDEALWRKVADHEARYSACRLYLARLNGRPAGACDLFLHEGWGRIDSVATWPEFRRRGVASALVARAIADSLTSGSRETYLFTEPHGAAERLYLALGFVPWRMNVFRQHRG